MGGGVICTVGRGLAPAVNSHRTLRRGQNSPNSGTLLSASQTFPLSGESPRPTDKPICIAKNLRGAESSPPTHALHFYFSIGTVKTVPYGCRGDSRIARSFSPPRGGISGGSKILRIRAPCGGGKPPPYSIITDISPNRGISPTPTNGAPSRRPLQDIIPGREDL